MPESLRLVTDDLVEQLASCSAVVVRGSDLSALVRWGEIVRVETDGFDDFFETTTGVAREEYASVVTLGDREARMREATAGNGSTLERRGYRRQ